MRQVVLAGALLVACQSNDSAPLPGKLALPAGARSVAPMAAARAGGRVQTSACYAGRDPAELAAELQDALRGDWGVVRLIPNHAVPGRFVVVGERDGFGVSGVVDAPRSGECDAGEIWVGVGAHPLGPASSATTAGPSGPRRHERTRLPIVPRPE